MLVAGELSNAFPQTNECPYLHCYMAETERCSVGIASGPVSPPVLGSTLWNSVVRKFHVFPAFMPASQVEGVFHPGHDFASRLSVEVPLFSAGWDSTSKIPTTTSHNSGHESDF
jgi:hypothetical protein